MSTLLDAGENALLLYPENPNPDTINSLCHTLKQSDAIIELVPAYTSILIYYHPEYATTIKSKVKKLLAKPLANKQTKSKTIHIPVYYDVRVAPDLTQLAQEKTLDIAEVIRIHSQTHYQVYAVGFAPGFAYLGMVDEAIALPRLDQPRPHIPAGSIGIANRQTAVYPTASPAGWNIIGRTPLDLSLAKPENLTRFAIGDTVVFTPIDHKTYQDLGGSFADAI